MIEDKYTYTHFPYPEEYIDFIDPDTGKPIPKKKNEQTMNDITDVLKDGSYLFYEFEDCTIEIPLTVDAGEVNPGVYTRHISPLFYKEVMNNEANWGLLDIITEEVPFYYMEPEGVFEEDDILLSATRDIGVTNVPSPLQDNDFWMVWFRDALGFVKNSMLLDIYNKMRYPYILENQYLNARVFNRLATELSSTQGNIESRIGFKTTDEENAEVYNPEYPFYGHEIGCLDYIEEVVERKVDSTYSFIDFNPEYSGFLSDWVESMYESGQLTYEEKKEEYLIFKLQDIRGELLRRKFAGTYSLYMLLMASMGKIGSYIGVITAGDSSTEAKAYYDEEGNIIGYVKSFNDSRPVRIPNIPGLFTEFEPHLDEINPISIYYEKPDELYKIPLGTLVPLFYSSTSIDYNGGEELNGGLEYNNELFYKTIDPEFRGCNAEQGLSAGYVEPTDILDYTYLSHTIPTDSSILYRSNFYRDSSNVILWDNMPGVLSQESLIEHINTLDTFVEEGDEGHKTYRYRTLDETYINDDGKEVYRTLDMTKQYADLSSVYGGVLDITADNILYHRNALQKQGDYQFVTYPIADGNGLCLMDTSWLNYLEYYSNQKSKVNEDITFGVQISTFIEIDADDLLTVPYEFFSYKYDQEKPGWIYIYHNLLRYKAFIPNESSEEPQSYKIESVESTLMSCIRLKHDAPADWYDDPEEKTTLKSEFKEFERFTKYNIGLIPFTYKGINNLEDLKLGQYGNTWYDDLETSGFAEVYFSFSNKDLPEYRFNNEYDWEYEGESKHLFGIDPIDLELSSESFKGKYEFTSCVKNTYKTSDEVRNIYFTVKRIEEGNVRFSWSAPIRVIPHNSIPQKNEIFKPDWLGLVYYLNPYFNYTQESASPLRHKEALKAPVTFVDAVFEEDGETIREPAHYVMNDSMPSECTALSNLARIRHLDYLCVDDNSNINNLSWIKEGYQGLYLAKTDVGSGIAIFGDNRYLGDDILYDRVEEVFEEFPTKIDFSVLYHLNIKIITDEGTIYSKTYEPGYYQWRTTDIDIEFIKLSFDPTKKQYSDIYRDDLSIPVLHFEESDEKNDSLELISVGTGTPWYSNANKWTICAHVNSVKSSVELIEGITINCGVGDHRISISSNGKCFIDENEATSSVTFSLSNDMTILPGFLGDLYDFRLYKEEREDLKVLNMGMFRELYSYAPSNYKLAHSIYVDNALVRMVDNTSDNTTPYGIKKIGALRAFNRSVWDSIMLDMYPTSIEEATINSPQYYEFYKNPIDDSDIYKVIYGDNILKTYLNDCVEQSLLEDLEVFNGREIVQGTTLIHNGKRYPLSKNSYVTAVLSLIQPVNCKDDPTNESKSYLRLNSSYGLVTSEDAGGSITIPMKSDSSDDFFKYSVDLDINFSISPESNFSWFIARGSNVSLRYNTSIENTLTVLDNTTVRGSEKNYVLLPLCIPEQESDTWLDKFYVRDFLLSEVMSSFLKSTTYYNEIKIPVPCQITEEGFDPINVEIGGSVSNWIRVHGGLKVYEFRYDRTEDKNDYYETADETFLRDKRYYFYNTDKKSNTFYNKWDAIRTLKEGEYIFTCKYPMKILPFSDVEFSGNTKDYNTVYGTMRFKIVVSGTPKEMTNEEIVKYSIPRNIPEDYKSYNLESTLKSSTNRVDPNDNYTFPHREMAIRLYVYDVLSNRPSNWPSSVDYKPIAGLMGEVKGSTEKIYTETYAMGWNLIASNIRSEAIEDVYEHATLDGWNSKNTYYRYVSESDSFEIEPNPILSDLSNYFVYAGEIPLNDMVYLNKETLDNGVVIRKKCPMFMSNNYIDSFYVSNYDRVEESQITYGSNDDDLIDPIVIKSDIFSDEENLMSRLKDVSGDNLNKITLLAGKTYKILFDYTSSLCEFKYETSESDSDPANILDNSVEANINKYVYTESGENLNNFLDLLINSHGYIPDPNESLSGWDGWKNPERNGIALGNPYSNIKDYNLLADNDDSKKFSNTYQIRYYDELKVVIEDVERNKRLVSPKNAAELTYLYRLDNIKGYDANDTQVSIGLSEADLIKYHYDQIFPNSLNSTNVVKNMVSNACGIIGGFSYIKPNILYQANSQESSKEFLIRLDPKALPNESSKENSNDNMYKLCSYQTPSWRIPYQNTISLTRTAAPQDSNPILTEPFEKFNNNYWTFKSVGLIYNDLKKEEGTVKIYVGPDIHNGHIKFSYKKGTNQMNCLYTMSLMIHPGDDMTVLSVKGILYNENAEVETCVMTAGDADADGWYTYEGVTDDSVLADSIEFDISVSRRPSESSEDTEIDNYMSFKSAIVKCQEAKQYKLGLSEVYNGGTPYDKSMIIVSHTIPVFNKTYKNDVKSVDVFVPIQFKPEVIPSNGFNRPIPGIYRAASFIDSCAVEKIKVSSRIRYLKAPWIRRMNLYYQGDDVEVEFHKYGVRKNSLNTLEYREIYSSVNDIYKVNDSVDMIRVTPSESKENYRIDFTGGILMDLLDDGTIRAFNNNLRVIGAVNPIGLVNEKTSYTYNCFDLNKYRQGLNSYVGITNVQLLNRDLINDKGTYDNREIIYELEYLPIIYDELKNHISFNIMFHHIGKKSEGTSDNQDGN